MQEVTSSSQEGAETAQLSQQTMLQDGRTVYSCAVSSFSLPMMVSVHCFHAKSYIVPRTIRVYLTSRSTELTGIWHSVVGGVGGPVYSLLSGLGCMHVGGRFDRVCISDAQVVSFLVRETNYFDRTHSFSRMQKQSLLSPSSLAKDAPRSECM